MATVHDRYSDEQIESYYRAEFWRPESLAALIRSHLDERADKQFVFDSTTSLTYNEMYDQARHLASALRGLGIQAGDRVVVQLPNWSEFVMIACATGFLGAVIVPIMPIYRADEVAYVVNHSGAKAAITCAQFRGFAHLDMFRTLAQQQCPALGPLIVARCSGQPVPPGVLRLEDLLQAPIDETAAEAGPDEPFLIVYTSGTTSRPKGCLHTVNTLRASRIAMYRCTVTVAATAFLQMITEIYDPSRHDMSSMRLWNCAGSVIPPVVVRTASEVFPGCRINSLYGRSENFLTTMCTFDDPPERSLSSDGRPVRGASVKVVDEAGSEVPRGQAGDVAYRGPSHMLEYFRDPEQTAALFTPDGYSRSGDLGVMTDDDYVRITGRIKDIVIRGGMNISATELEELLIEFPAVRDVAVVAMPDVRLGEKVCVYVVPVSMDVPPTLTELTDYLRGRDIATSKLPERLEIVEKFPLSATGKLRKDVLRADIASKIEDAERT